MGVDPGSGQKPNVHFCRIWLVPYQGFRHGARRIDDVPGSAGWSVRMGIRHRVRLLVPLIALLVSTGMLPATAQDNAGAWTIHETMLQQDMAAERARRERDRTAPQVDGLSTLAAVPPAAPALSCEHWNTEEFFAQADAATVGRCLGEGASPVPPEPIFTHVRGPTPLHLAASRSSGPDVVRLLIEAGADHAARGEWDWAALHYAATWNSNPKVVAALLDAGVVLEVRDQDARTPLHSAARSGAPAVVAALLDAGADFEARDESGRTPLHYVGDNQKSRAVVTARRTRAADPGRWSSTEGPWPTGSELAYSPSSRATRKPKHSSRTPRNSGFRRAW